MPLGILSGLARKAQPGASHMAITVSNTVMSILMAAQGRQACDLNGMEASWLLDPSIPLTDVFREYTSSLARLLALPSGTP